MKIIAFAAGVLFSLAAGTAEAQSAAADTDPGHVELRAQVIPKRYTTLSGEIAARIEKLAFKDGDRFKEGQLLVSLDCALQRAQLAEAQAGLTAAIKTRDVTKRMVELNSGGILEAEVAASDAIKAKARVDAAQAVISKCTIYAPYQGRIVEEKVREYQYIQPGAVIMDILDDSTLEVEFIAPSQWLSWVKPGLPFSVQVDELNKSYPAQVTRISAKVDAVSHSIKITGEITKGSIDLIAGMSGRVIMANKP